MIIKIVDRTKRLISGTSNLNYIKLGEKFSFSGKWIKVFDEETGYKKKYFLDSLDPFNELGGMLDGRTYGNGRFILTYCYQEHKVTYTLSNKGMKSSKERFIEINEFDVYRWRAGACRVAKFCGKNGFRGISEVIYNPTQVTLKGNLLSSPHLLNICHL